MTRRNRVTVAILTLGSWVAVMLWLQNELSGTGLFVAFVLIDALLELVGHFTKRGGKSGGEHEKT